MAITDPHSAKAAAPKRELGWRERMEIVPGRHRPKRVRNGAIFVVAAAIFLWILYTKPTLPFLAASGTELTAELRYGANVRPGYTPVRVHGVDVGQVTSVRRSPSGRGVEMVMKIDDGKGVKLRRDASLALRWRTLLGRNMYVDLNPGSPSAPRLGRAFIPRSRTSDQVELDTALEPLDAHGRGAVRSMIGEFDRGFSDARAVGDTVDAVAPAMRSLTTGLEAMRGSDPGNDLPGLVATTSQAMGALTHDEVALGGLIDKGHLALGVTAARRADLAAILESAPGTLRDTRATLSRLDRTLDVLDPLATKLVPGAAKLDAAAARTQTALRTAAPLLADLRPTFRDLRPAVKDLDRAAVTGTPAVGPLTSTLKRVNDTFVPFLHAKNGESKRPNYQNIGPAIASLSTATSWGDKHGPVANFEAAAGENAVVDSPCDTALTNPAAAQLVQCEVLSRTLVALLTGRKPQDVEVRDGAVSKSRLAPYLDGKEALKRHPKLAPLDSLRRQR